MAEVLSVQLQPDGQPYFSQPTLSQSPLRRSPPPPQTSLYIGSPPFSPRKQQFSPVEDNSPLAHSSPTSSISSASNSQIELTPPSSRASANPSFISYETSFDLGRDEDLSFPAYGTSSAAFSEDLEPPESPLSENSYTIPSPPSDSTPTNTPETSLNVVDDTAVRPEPSRHVDYLSHDWREEDIWSSWRYIVSKRWHYGERSREENASWRTWAKQKYRLRTVPPDTLNWYVDHPILPMQKVREWLT